MSIYNNIIKIYLFRVQFIIKRDGYRRELNVCMQEYDMYQINMLMATKQST